LLVFILGLALFSTTLSAQVVYKWVDTDGSIKFSDQMPHHVKPKNLQKITVRNNSSFKTVKEIAKKQAKTLSQQQQELVDMTKKNCDIANKNLKLLNAFDNIRQTDANGNEVILTAEQKAQQIDLTIKQAEIYCTQ